MLLWLRAGLVLALVALSPHAYALDPGRTLTQYVHRIWQVQHGLPQAWIDSIVQTRDGYPWACTPNGLAELTDGRVRVFGTADGLSSPDVHAACIAPDGTLRVGAGDDSQLATWNGSRFLTRALSLPNAATIQSMLCAADGTVWIGTSDGLIRAHAGREDRLTVANGLADNSILTLTETHEGSVLAGTTNGFSRIRGSEIDSFRPQDGLSQSTVYSLYEDREGSLWAATKHGLNQFLDGRAIPYTTREGLPSNNTGPVLQDRHGTIWVGTLGGGLAQFDGHRFVALTTEHGLSS